MVERMYGWPAGYGFRRAVPSAPGVGRTRHPVSGAVWQLRLPCGNLLQTRQLTDFRSPWFLSSNRWFPYGNLLIPLGVTPCPICLAGSNGRCNTIQNADSTSFPRESYLFGCNRSEPSQGSILVDLTLASDFSFCFQCKVSFSLVLHRPIETTLPLSQN